MADNYTFESLIGDMPVSVQINTALANVAAKDHVHDEYALRNEVEDLKQKLNMLISLVGDVPVSEQICAAIQNIEKAIANNNN